jgi:hypothetical protein
MTADKKGTAPDTPARATPSEEEIHDFVTDLSGVHAFSARESPLGFAAICVRKALARFAPPAPVYSDAAVEALIEAADAARIRLWNLAEIFNDSNFTDRYGDGPRTRSCHDKLDLALAALRSSRSGEVCQVVPPDGSTDRSLEIQDNPARSGERRVEGWVLMDGDDPESVFLCESDAEINLVPPERIVPCTIIVHAAAREEEGK